VGIVEPNALVVDVAVVDMRVEMEACYAAAVGVVWKIVEVAEVVRNLQYWEDEGQVVGILSVGYLVSRD
jgi:hypothetical protein